MGYCHHPDLSGWAVPIPWNGELSDVPSGYTQSLRRAMVAEEIRGAANTLVICARIVHPQMGPKGWPRICLKLSATLPWNPSAQLLHRFGQL